MIAGVQMPAGGVSTPPVLKSPPERANNHGRLSRLSGWGVRAMKKPLRNKRREGHFVMLHAVLLNSLAYRSLSCPARALLVEIALAYNGRNNGTIGLSVRRAAGRCNIAAGTAKCAFEDLQEHGLIECVTKGGFNRKTRHASEWRLTFHKCDVTGDLPSKAFNNWGKENQNTVSNCPDTVSNQTQLPEKNAA